MTHAGPGHSDWLVGDRKSAAAERIYAAATDLVIRDGLDALDVDTLAGLVHCSRATVYRYAGGKAQIRDAVVMRVAAGIVDTVRHAVDGLAGPERVLTAIAVALEQIRRNPIRQLFMSMGTSAGLLDLRSSAMLSGIAAELTGVTDEDPQAALWIVHVVVSLAYLPLADPESERDIVRRFVAPAFTP